MEEPERKSLVRLSVNVDSVRDILTFLNDEVANHSKDIANIKNLLSNLVSVKRFNELEMMVTDLSDNYYKKFDELYPNYTNIMKEIDERFDMFQKQMGSTISGVYQELSTRIGKIEKTIEPMITMQSKLNNYVDKLDKLLSDSGDLNSFRSIIDLNRRVTALEQAFNQRNNEQDELFQRLRELLEANGNIENFDIETQTTRINMHDEQTNATNNNNDSDNDKNKNSNLDEFNKAMDDLNKLTIDSNSLDPNKNRSNQNDHSKRENYRKQIQRLEIPVEIAHIAPTAKSSREIGSLMKVVVSQRSSHPVFKASRKYPQSSRK